MDDITQNEYHGIMKPDFSYEPGVIRAFRLFAGVRLAMVSVSAIFSLLPTAWHETSPSISFLAVLDALVLFLFLSMPSFQKWLRALYLPVGLAIATIGPILEQVLGFRAAYNQLNFSEGLIQPGAWQLIQVSGWQLIPVLFIPLFILAWQYRFRWVVLFCALTALVDMAAVLVMSSDLSLMVYRALIIGPMFVRTGSFLFVGYMIAQLVGAQRKQREELGQANASLARHAETLEELATSRERNRVARELHDILAHTLSGLAIELEAVKKLWAVDAEKAQLMLEHALGSVREGLTETRRALQALRASPLEDLGLIYALRSLAESVAARANFHLQLDLPEKIGGLPPEVEQVYYRTAQEALTNILEHAGARMVQVSLLQAADGLVLTVSDDGRGFNPENMDDQNQLGLVGMRERALMIGAVLKVDSQVEKGTTIRLAYRGEK